MVDLSKRRKKYQVFSCEVCGNTFELVPWRVSMCIKVGKVPRFCGPSCRAKALVGENSSSYLHFKVSGNFVGQTASWWKRKLIKEVRKCEQCGWNEHPEILTLHHRDRNKKNNVRKNLRLLCPNCHDWKHYKTKSGNYCFRKKWKGVTGKDHPRYGNSTRHDLYVAQQLG